VVRQVLLSRPGVRDALVHAAARTTTTGAPRIVAHAVAPGQDPAVLLADLNALLPPRLHPAELHTLARIPRAPDGTCDTAALPTPANMAGAATGPERVELTPHQHTLLREILAHPGTGRHVGQYRWRWHGRLDTDRFTAAWQSVFDHESVLRAAFTCPPPPDRPAILLCDHATPEVVRHSAHSVDFEQLLHTDLRRGFDLSRPGLLRLTLVDEPAPGPGQQPATRILLTFPHLLLDPFSAVILIQEFYRAYLAGGILPGGERRPDLRDYARWLAAQDTAPAREFFSRALARPTPAISPARPGPATGQSGFGRAHIRLSGPEMEALGHWAAAHAATESGALHAIWAILLHSAAPSTGPGPVGFGVAAPGRGIALPAAERLPGLLMNVTPVTVRVDPAQQVPLLLAQLRDQEFDRAAYEWVSLGQIHQWSGRAHGERLIESLIDFAHHPRGAQGLTAQLAAQHIRVSTPTATGAPTAFPLALLAHRDGEGGLVLCAVHDRSRIADADAAKILHRCARLLRALPRSHTPLTIRDALALVADTDPPRIAGHDPHQP
jgi:hypothetical protein